MNKKFDYLLLIFENSLHTGKKREFPGKNHLFPVFPFSRKFKKSGKLSTLLPHILDTKAIFFYTVSREFLYTFEMSVVFTT